MAPKKAADSVRKTRGPSHIAKEDGRPAVEAWLEHVKPEHRGIVRRIDALILETVPDAVCAVKFRKPTNRWGVPFYGLSGNGWIVSVNSLKAQVRMIFFAGKRLKPMPPLAAPPGARAVDVHRDGDLDERQIKAWLQQAKKAPGLGSAVIAVLPEPAKIKSFRPAATFESWRGKNHPRDLRTFSFKLRCTSLDSRGYSGVIGGSTCLDVSG